MLNVERFSLLSRGFKLTEIKHIQQIIHASSVTRNLATNLLSVIMLGLSMEKKNVNVMSVMIFFHLKISKDIRNDVLNKIIVISF